MLYESSEALVVAGVVWDPPHGEAGWAAALRWAVGGSPYAAPEKGPDAVVHFLQDCSETLSAGPDLLSDPTLGVTASAQTAAVLGEVLFCVGAVRASEEYALGFRDGNAAFGSFVVGAVRV